VSPVATHSYTHFQQTGTPPGAPSAVTSITRDAAAAVSFRPPADQGSGAITAYVITPYVAGSPQAATTVPVASLGSITGSDGNVYRQAQVTGLANSTAYTFTARARNSYGDSAESDASGANTPLAGLVFGDDFNGPAGGPIDPEWWVYNRCGYLAQSEVEWYLPDHCVLDGTGGLALIAEKLSYTGTTYPSDGNRSVTQPWRSGACQSNVKTWAPAAGNTMTFESRHQICHDVSGGMWPGLFWLNGQSALNWKNDPAQGGWNSTDHAEIDIAETIPGQTDNTSYLNNSWVSSSPSTHTNSGATDFSAAMHVYTCRWKPGVSVTFLRDGAQTFTTGTSPASGCQMVLLLYLQIMSGSATATQRCTIDYVRVYDQNLG
jgi:Fibronectin type III domain/Glycosyl hydrolases family 16